MRTVPLLVLAVVTLGGCRDREQIGVFTGEAMGTTYRIKHVGELDLPRLGIGEMLAGLDRDLSTWRDDSWLSGFNRAPAGTVLEMPPSVASLLELSRRMCRETEGCFDPTVGALVRLWGFGAWRDEWQGEPSPEALAAAREASGFRNLQVEGNRITKLNSALMLDFSGIAKGHAVDRIGELLRRAGCDDFVIEFGGEVLACGGRPGRPGWTIDGPALKQPIELLDRAIASSGSEHQFRDSRSHVIDPRAGHPIVVGPPVFATAATCAEADALATARLVRATVSP